MPLTDSSLSVVLNWLETLQTPRAQRGPQLQSKKCLHRAAKPLTSRDTIIMDRNSYEEPLTPSPSKRRRLGVNTVDLDIDQTPRALTINFLPGDVKTDENGSESSSGATSNSRRSRSTKKPDLSFAVEPILAREFPTSSGSTELPAALIGEIAR
jgi:hypothetical protein